MRVDLYIRPGHGPGHGPGVGLGLGLGVGLGVGLDTGLGVGGGVGGMGGMGTWAVPYVGKCWQILRMRVVLANIYKY